MTEKLRAELKQKKPFASVEQEAFLNLQRTADALMRGLEELLKPSGLTQTQYNVLRILRGAKPDGLLCRELSERMVTRDPDITRLLDRLDMRGLISRLRDRKDRRALTVRITAAGEKLVSKLDAPVARFHCRQLSHLGELQLHRLIDLLEGARGLGRDSAV
jgi:DNA-binding MarR family transcriptional regulator